MNRDTKQIRNGNSHSLTENSCETFIFLLFAFVCVQLYPFLVIMAVLSASAFFSFPWVLLLKYTYDCFNLNWRYLFVFAMGISLYSLLTSFSLFFLSCRLYIFIFRHFMHFIIGCATIGDTLHISSYVMWKLETNNLKISWGRSWTIHLQANRKTIPSNFTAFRYNVLIHAITLNKIAI